MNTESKAKQLAGYSFLVIFAKDHGITDGELHMLEKLALEDHQIDEAERKVLKNIFSRIDKDVIADSVKAELESFVDEHDLDS